MFCDLDQSSSIEGFSVISFSYVLLNDNNNDDDVDNNYIQIYNIST